MAAATTATCQKAGVIFLHGLGDTPAGWSDIKHQMAQLNPKLASPEITWDFPAAPVIPISVNGGATMPGWFDLYDWPIDVTAPDDPAGTMRAVETIRGAIAKLEAAGVPTERIVVGGFSQGGAIALNTAYRHPAKLGGCVALSGWLNMKADFAEGKEFPTEASKATPCLWGHGAMDDKVLFPHQKIGVDLLTAGRDRAAELPWATARNPRSSPSSPPSSRASSSPSVAPGGLTDDTTARRTPSATCAVKSAWKTSKSRARK
ncbi:acyl-protein thioesterase [Aureococcus anophagefferens]|nr:acyl-protein thioesterase [Aureococcus anophagefferens]